MPSSLVSLAGASAGGCSLRKNEAWHEEDQKTRNPIPKLSRAPMVPRPAMRPNSGAWRILCAGSMDAAEYKHVVLGLLFLKYISDAFEERHVASKGSGHKAPTRKTRDEYRAENIFWVPPEARWTQLKAGQSNPLSASRSTRRRPASSATIRRSRMCYPRTTPARRWTSSGSASSSI